MPRFTFDPNRLNFTVSQTGREYQLRLLQRSQAIFSSLLNLLPSNYVSTIAGPNYTVELKAVAVELAKIELTLEDVDRDRDFRHTRPEFLYSIVGYLLLTNGRLPPLEFSDKEFQNFLLALVAIYFQGSVPKSIRDVAALFLSGDVRVTENFLEVRAGASGFDISDQFGFGIDVVLPEGAGFPSNVIGIDATIRLLLNIVRPAHTLFRIRFVFREVFHTSDVVDAMQWCLRVYHYDDFRTYWAGLRDRDRLGRKVNRTVTDEEHHF